MAEKKQNNELDLEQMGQVAGGYVEPNIKSRFFGADVKYRAVDDKTGQTSGWTKDVNEAIKWDKNMNEK